MIVIRFTKIIADPAALGCDSQATGRPYRQLQRGTPERIGTGMPLGGRCRLRRHPGATLTIDALGALRAHAKAGKRVAQSITVRFRVRQR
jgi:hypothetical protein